MATRSAAAAQRHVTKERSPPAAPASIARSVGGSVSSAAASPTAYSNEANSARNKEQVLKADQLNDEKLAEVEATDDGVIEDKVRAAQDAKPEDTSTAVEDKPLSQPGLGVLYVPDGSHIAADVMSTWLSRLQALAASSTSHSPSGERGMCFPLPPALQQVSVPTIGRDDDSTQAESILCFDSCAADGSKVVHARHAGTDVATYLMFFEQGQQDGAARRRRDSQRGATAWFNILYQYDSFASSPLWLRQPRDHVVGPQVKLVRCCFHVCCS